MNNSETANNEASTFKKRNYKPWIIAITIIVNGLVIILSGMPGYDNFDLFNVHILPMMNAIFNSFTFTFLLIAFIMILRKNVTWHRRFIYAAFGTTTLFLITYISYHFLSPSTPFGGDGIVAAIYYFVLITHIVLAAIIVPLVLITVTRAWNMENELHKKIARWTMPLWLYVSFTGVLVYLMISPYY
ncbi:DUF420 domain-containing protein [Alkalihalobacillus pseudalcaliphilus]|uniref:DUF420 domain-containing protein n=1 Tax=Alkalihalobacillus pseudalcaliphilus TaxID=79884 RepID=UPI00064D8B6B|nr:DUF420 domain-containing protein [Alkalihalobacillus pseudalcaliphilus]KMK77087.1 membrane protein [Alkalihalobacillus pseudalcaliphilus]